MKPVSEIILGILLHVANNTLFQIHIAMYFYGIRQFTVQQSAYHLQYRKE